MSTVMVTGANRGIGLGLIRQLLARPLSVYPKIIATARRLEQGELAELAEGSDGRLVRLGVEDIGDVEAVQKLAREVGKVAPKGVNILINNAARATTPSFRLPSLAGALEYQSTLRTNTFGPVLLTCILIHHRLLSGINANPIDPDRPSFASSRMRVPTTNTGLTSDTSKARGSLPVVVNISSTQGSMSYASEIWSGGSTRDDLIFHPIYAASKVGLSGATMQLARELREEAIVNCLHPGWVRTEAGRAYAPLSIDESASKMLDVIATWKSVKDSGQWVNEEGKRIPW